MNRLFIRLTMKIWGRVDVFSVDLVTLTFINILESTFAWNHTALNLFFFLSISNDLQHLRCATQIRFFSIDSRKIKCKNSQIHVEMILTSISLRHTYTTNNNSQYNNYNVNDNKKLRAHFRLMKGNGLQSICICTCTCF